MQRKFGRRVLASVAAVAMLAAGCTRDAEPDDEEPTEQPGDRPSDDEADEPVAPEPSCGTTGLVWAHEQTPPDLHVDDPDNSLSITSWIRQSLWEGLYGISGADEFFPELLARELVVVPNGDGTVTFNGALREDLTWSDGTAVTAQQVVDTYAIVMEGYDAAADDPAADAVYLVADRSGWDLIQPDSIEATSATEFTFTMSRFFAGYKALFSEVFPTHVVPDAATANDAFRDFEVEGTTLPSTGPMVFASLEPDVVVELVTNESYHGSVSPDVENDGVACVTGVTITAVPGREAQIEALETGETDFLFAEPQVEFQDLVAGDDRFTVASVPGPVYEHWGLNLYDEHLRDPLVREAVALAMDKSAVVERLYTPLFGAILPPEGLGNTYWMPNQAPYVDTAGGAGYGQGDAPGAIAKLEEAGYTNAGDGLYEHPERGRLTLRVGTPGGSSLRTQQQELLQRQLAAAGIEVVIDNVERSDYFGARPFSAEALACATGTPDGETTEVGGVDVTADCDVWDIAQFAWIGGPWPGGNSAAARCGSGDNPYGYCNQGFDELALECDSSVDEVARVECYNTLDSYITTLGPDGDGLFMLPITQQPAFYAYSSERLVRGAVAPDANDAGPLVNVVDFQPAA